MEERLDPQWSGQVTQLKGLQAAAQKISAHGHMVNGGLVAGTQSVPILDRITQLEEENRRLWDFVHKGTAELYERVSILENMVRGF